MGHDQVDIPGAVLKSIGARSVLSVQLAVLHLEDEGQRHHEHRHLYRNHLNYLTDDLHG